MKRLIGKLGSPGILLGVIAIVVALTGSAIAGLPQGGLKLANFNDSSRDRLAGTGVVEYASQTYSVADTGYGTLATYSVQCEGSKQATAGGWKWTGPIAPAFFDYAVHDAYPAGGRYIVRIYSDHPGQLTVYANCVKSRDQKGTPAS